MASAIGGNFLAQTETLAVRAIRSKRVRAVIVLCMAAALVAAGVWLLMRRDPDLLRLARRITPPKDLVPGRVQVLDRATVLYQPERGRRIPSMWPPPSSLDIYRLSIPSGGKERLTAVRRLAFYGAPPFPNDCSASPDGRCASPRGSLRSRGPRRRRRPSRGRASAPPRSRGALPRRRPRARASSPG